MRATWRPLPAWPYQPSPRGRSTFQVGWTRTLEDLEGEIEKLNGHDLLIGVVADESQFTIAGTLRSGAKVRHAGAEVSFDVKNRGRLVFHTDAFPTLQENLRGIGLGLAALRAIERYGITSAAGEQFAGFAALTAGGPDIAKGKLLVERAGGIRAALMAHHPDRGGDPRDFADVQAFRDSQGGGL